MEADDDGPRIWRQTFTQCFRKITMEHVLLHF